ncbi:Receptor-type tyrosine-protein phosphatase delta-like 1 [Homarus americanus]|uniref:Receptor-type tyrosine-protein phosphatase delta-like 1 n=1 Tax=Homarus americanus TaxID=6706 RepID=A0A8J5TTX1_HOMAM|nr:Receptor-type tyrosine-protein phosphatase delta-like 1 [Homarus americanus]
MLMTHTPDLLGDNFATIYDLVGCTNYTFQVSAVSAKDVQGSTRTTYASTEDADPTPVVSLTATAVDTNTVSAQWTPSVMEECVDHYHVCITDVDDLSKNCYDTTDHMKSFKASVLSNLAACGQYEITVKSVSPSGRLGGFIYDMAKTEDLPTSPPTDLEVSNVRPHSAVASFSPPLENPHCVHEYKANIIQLEDVSNLKHAELATSQSLVQTLAGLDACTNYGLWISAVTLSGYTSKQVNQNFTTGEEKPSAPRALSYTEIAQDYISLQWFMPQDNALCAEEYRLNWTSSTDSGHQDFTLPNHPVEVSVKVINLSSCTSYTFTVLAVTPLGVEGQTASLTVSTAC